MKIGFSLLTSFLMLLFLHGQAAANPCGDPGPYEEHDHKSETSLLSIDVVVGH